jgi:hypothetical protein
MQETTMTSISSATAQNFSSPLQLLQKELQSEVSAGTIGASDQTAISTALDDIDSALRGGGASSAGSGSAPPSPSDIKSKIDSLIAAEVKKGTLTSSQADEIKNIFAKALPAHGPENPAGTGQAGDSSDSSSTSSTSGSSGTSSSSSASSTDQVLQDFLKLLQDAQGSTSYSATGNSQTTVSALLVSIQT